MRTSHSSSSTQTFVPVSFIFPALKKVNEAFVAMTCILTLSYCDVGALEMSLIKRNEAYRQELLDDERNLYGSDRAGRDEENVD